MTPRSLKALHPARRDDIGDLVTRRPLPGPGIDQLDPFLLLNHHGPQVYPPGSRGLPFGPHPHRGIETVTFILAGELAHADNAGRANAGHASVIGAGGVQWMTAGRGLIHAELSPASFKRAGGKLEILQLWLNLPARLKMTEPRYVGLQRGEIPVAVLDGGRVRLNAIAGSWEGQAGPVAAITDVHIATLELAPGGRARFPVAPGRSIFLYVVRGTIGVAGHAADAFSLLDFAEDGNVVELAAESEAVLIFGHAMPLREPVVAHGPFVMNTREEIAQAIRDYEAGKFGDAPPVR